MLGLYLGLPIGSQAGIVSPANISGLEFWVRGDQGIIKDGLDRVSQWSDLSGNNNHATQATDSLKPIFNPGATAGQDAVNFDGIDDFMDANGVASIFNGTDKSYTIFMVIATTGLPAGSDTVIGCGRTSSFTPFIKHSAEPAASSARIVSSIRDDASSSKVTNCNRFSTSTPHILTICSNGNQLSYFIDGATDLQNLDFDVGTTTLDLFTLGALKRSASTQDFFDGDIAEILIYNRELLAAEKNEIHTYFGDRYSIQTLGPEDEDLNKVSGLQQWLRADLGITILPGNKVSAWADQSIASNNALQALALPQPIFEPIGFNGLEDVRFDGLTHFMNIDSVASVFNASDPAFTISRAYEVVSTPTTNGAIIGTGLSSDVTQYGYSGIDNTPNMREFKTSGASASVTSSGVISGRVYTTTVCHGTTIDLYINGVADTTGAAFSGGYTNQDQCKLGALQRGVLALQNYSAVKLAEQAIWNRALNSSEVVFVESGIKARWGL